MVVNNEWQPVNTCLANVYVNYWLTASCYWVNP